MEKITGLEDKSITVIIAKLPVTVNWPVCSVNFYPNQYS